MFFQVLSHKFNGALHSSNVVLLTLALLLEQVEDGIIDQRVKSVVKEFPHGHVLVVVLVLDHLQKVIEQVLVRATLLSVVNAVNLFMVLLDLLHVKVDFLFKQIIWVTSAVELDLHKVLVTHHHFDKVHFRFVGPMLFLALSEFQLGEVLVLSQDFGHDFETSVVHDAQVKLRNVSVQVACFQDSEQSGFSKVDLLEAKF